MRIRSKLTPHYVLGGGPSTITASFKGTLLWLPRIKKPFDMCVSYVSFSSPFSLIRSKLEAAQSVGHAMPATLSQIGAGEFMLLDISWQRLVDGSGSSCINLIKEGGAESLLKLC